MSLDVVVDDQVTRDQIPLTEQIYTTFFQDKFNQDYIGHYEVTNSQTTTRHRVFAYFTESGKYYTVRTSASPAQNHYYISEWSTLYDEITPRVGDTFRMSWAGETLNVVVVRAGTGGGGGADFSSTQARMVSGSSSDETSYDGSDGAGWGAVPGSAEASMASGAGSYESSYYAAPDSPRSS